tara:strand:+ start:354 stop:518 length:165 start_codon:yes stop_codon:yes gene_type:complete
MSQIKIYELIPSKKAKLFEEVNLGLQGFVIRAKRSSLDKRYKVIEINLSIIETA